MPRLFPAIHVIGAQEGQIDRSWIVALQYCSYFAAFESRQLRCKTAAESFKEPSKAAQRFCIPLQLEWSCCLASKRLLNSCNLAVQLFWSDFVALYSAASFVRECSLSQAQFFLLFLMSDHACPGQIVGSNKKFLISFFVCWSYFMNNLAMRQRKSRNN